MGLTRISAGLTPETLERIKQIKAGLSYGQFIEIMVRLYDELELDEPYQKIAKQLRR